MNISKLLLSSMLLTSACGDDPTGSLPDMPDAAPQALLDVTVTAIKVPILQGTTATVAVKVTRFEGLTGPVEVMAIGLPLGVTADPLTIGAGESTGTLTLRAASAAAHSLPTSVQVRGVIGAVADDAPITVTVVGRPGALDTSFSGGKLMLPVGGGDDYAFATAVQPDGKILVAGRSAEHLQDFAMIRLERDGAIDPTFGTGGIVMTDFAGGSDTIRAIALQADGKIVAAGVSTVAATGNDFALARYSSDGTLDASFGTGGKLTTPIGPDSDTAYAVLVQPDGKIVVGGDSSRGSNQTGVDFALARYTSAGVLDAAYGTNGIVLTDIATNGGRDSIYALARQPDGKIVAVGGEGDFTLARYTETGALDPSFGTGGKQHDLFGSVIGAARAVQIAPSGEILVAGHSQEAVAVARLTSAGVLDAGFGTGGRVITKLSATNWNEAQGLALESSGKIVVAGWAYEGNGSAGNFAVVRYTATGALDADFGESGVVITGVAANNKADQGMALALQVDDRIPATRIIVAGYASTNNSEFAVTRYWR